MHIMIEQKEATVIFEETEPVYVWADEFKIEEVVTNYTSNALNHLDGERKVEIKVLQEEDCVKVTVFNTGTPIPEEDIPNLWNKFYKVDKARTREYGGSGIGLSIVAASMAAHNKNYGVYNVENGVVFYFDLDIIQQEMYLFHGMVHCKCGKRCDHVSTVKTKNKYRHTYYYYWCPKCNKRVNQDKLFNQIVIPLGLHINSNKTSEQLKKLEDDLLFFKDRRSQILDDYINANIDVTTYDLSMKKVKKMIFDIGKKIKEFDESGIRQLIYADRVTKRKLIQTHISYITYDFELGDVTNIVYKTKK